MNKDTEPEPVFYHLGKYPPSAWDEPEMTDAEKVVAYISCMFRDVTLTQVASWEKLEWFCKSNGYTKKFVLDVIKDHLKIDK